MNRDKILTIFTPTYNRGYILQSLYESLINQKNKQFIWLVVDDGSIDDTPELINSWKNEGIIEIQYHRQENKGKSLAHNWGVELSETELFACVDSDDSLTVDAVEIILDYWKKTTDIRIIGFLAYRGVNVNQPITKLKDKTVISDTLYQLYHYHGLSGDTMLIYKTSVIKKYKFPALNNEKFVPEAYLYDLLDKEGELLVIKKILYLCEYLDDGYTKNMTKTIKNNPEGYTVFLANRINIDKKMYYKLINYIKLSAVLHYNNKNFEDYSIRLNIFFSLMLRVLGYIAYIIKYYKR